MKDKKNNSDGYTIKIPKYIMDDGVFGQVLSNPKSMRYLERLIELFLGYEEESLRGKLNVSNEVTLPNMRYGDKTMRTDLIIRFDHIIIDIEAYTRYTDYTNQKSLEYIVKLSSQTLKKGDRYDKYNKTIQINFAKGIAKQFRSENIIQIENLTNKLDKYLVDVDKSLKIEYTEEVSKKLLNYIRFLGADAVLREKLSKEDEILMELNEVFNEFITNEDFLKEYSHEEIMKGTYLEAGRDEGIEIGHAEGRAEGREETQKETVMNMFKNGLTKEQISKYTEIPLDTVKSIIEDNKNFN